MLAKSYEETCAKCHDHQILDDTLPGLLIAAVPAVDVEPLRAAGIEIGQWPNVYPEHVEAQSTLAPFHSLISPHRDALWSVQDKLQGIDLADLSTATPEQLQDVKELIWTFKESLVDILAKGRPGLLSDFSAELKDLFNEEQIEGLVRAVPLEGLAAMQREWLPNVAEEVAARRAGTEIPVLEQDKADPVAPHAVNVIANDRHNSRLLNSGWSLHSPSMSLRYRPTRHADPLMKTLLDRSVTPRRQANLPSGSPAEAARRKLYNSLASPHASGRCRKCHTVDSNSPSGGETHINWESYKPPPAQHTFTHFNHAPHLAVQTNEACSRCHGFSDDDESDSPILRSEFVSNRLEPATVIFKSDFAHMSKSNCAECHTSQSAGDRCTTCHNYHVR
jgi:hypothetical protein